MRDGKDPETGERYTVKRYQSAKITEPDGAWRHSKITLLPNNPAFEPIILTAEKKARCKSWLRLSRCSGESGLDYFPPLLRNAPSLDDLRHFRASQWVMQGIDIRTVQELL